MYHQHFNTIGSTQIYLKNNLENLLEKESDILVSCSSQTEGVGRRGNSWQSFTNSLAMSFTLKPNPVASLTPIEVGVITVNFIKMSLGKDLKLKWPNDIMADGKKCGGIICQYINDSTVIVGLGLNLGKFEMPKIITFPYGLASVDPELELKTFDQERISKEFYTYLLNNRMDKTEDLKNSFNQLCYHINKDVFIFDGEDHIGIFRGIGDLGEALVEIDSNVKKFITSSLTVMD